MTRSGTRPGRVRRRADPGHHPQGFSPADASTAISNPGSRLVAIGASLVGFLVLLVAVLVTRGVDPADTAVLRWAVSVRMPWLTWCAQLVTTLGSTPVVIVVALLGAVLLRRRTRSWTSSSALLATVFGTDAIVYLTKAAVARRRPPVDTLIGLPAADYSFPSGHTANGGAVYLLAALLLAAALASPVRRRLLVAGGVLVGVAVGLTRVYLGYHWATDVLAGWCLAAAVALTGALVSQLLASPGGPHPGIEAPPARRAPR